MATFAQVSLRHKRISKGHKMKRQASDNNPQKAGTCVHVFTITPKKPCSARRAVTFVRLTNNKYILCKIPGEVRLGVHKLTKFSTVLIRGGRTLDIPGAKYKVIYTSLALGKYDLKPLNYRRNGRSKFAVRGYRSSYKTRDKAGLRHREQHEIRSNV
jgi:small subunit ribosomal protein S12